MRRGIKTYVHGPMDYAKTLKLRFRVGDLDLPERKGILVGGWRRKKVHRAAFVAPQTRIESTQWDNGSCTRRNGMC